MKHGLLFILLAAGFSYVRAYQMKALSINALFLFIDILVYLKGRATKAYSHTLRKGGKEGGRGRGRGRERGREGGRDLPYSSSFPKVYNSQGRPKPKAGSRNSI